MREHHHRLTDGDARSTGNAGKTAVCPALTGRADTQYIPARFRSCNHTRQLRRQGNQKGFFTVVKTALLLVLNNQYAQHLAMVKELNASSPVSDR